MSQPNTQLDQALAGLADITLGDSPSVWPLAWGWWAVIIFTIMIIAAITLFSLNYRNKRIIKRKALKAINKISENEPQALRKLHTILRAAAVHYYPTKDISKLHGNDWQAFLASQAVAQKRVTNEITEGLTNLESSLYTKNATISIAQAKQSIAVWLNCCVPPSNASSEDEINATRNNKNICEERGVQHV